MTSTIVRLLIVGVSILLIMPNQPLRTLVAFGGLGYCAVVSLIPRLLPAFIRIGLKGRDLLKPPPVDEIAESMGVVVAVTYLFLMFALIPFVFFKYLVSIGLNDTLLLDNYTDQYAQIENNNLFPHNKLAEYLSAVLCLQSTTLLGLFDDLFDIKWRHKFFLPAVASLPLLIVYYVDFSVTSIVVPTFVTNLPGGEIGLNVLNCFIKFGNHAVKKLTGLSFNTLSTDYTVPSSTPKLLDLGVFYYAYMSAVSIFLPNSINILAGINGLEVGQSIVLSVIFLTNDFCYLFSRNVSQAAYESHLFSAIFILPFVGVSLGLLQHNWFPARVFVGDTYCYFAGMVFAIVGILGHFSKTLLIFLLPQIVNFVYLVPQLFGVVPCPRHRMPRFSVDDNLMRPSYGVVKSGTLGSKMVSILGLLRLMDVKHGEDKVEFSNMTIINLFLVWFGPMREDTLCFVILAAQLAVGLVMVGVRHTVGPWLFGYDNLSLLIK